MFPFVDFHVNKKGRSCGVQLVLVHKRDRIEFSASSRTLSQQENPTLFLFRASVTDFHTIPLYRSTCPLPLGLYDWLQCRDCLEKITLHVIRMTLLDQSGCMKVVTIIIMEQLSQALII